MDRDKQKKLFVAVGVVVIGGMALYGYLSYKKAPLPDDIDMDIGIDTDIEQKPIVLTEEEYQKYLDDVKKSAPEDSVVLTPKELDSVFKKIEKEGSSQEQEKVVLTKEEWEKATQALGQ